jgi:hypothetical protein
VLSHASRQPRVWLIFNVSQKMGRQIRFFLCDSMRASIEGEAARRGVKLVDHSAFGRSIEFSHRNLEGRLWTEAVESEDYEALCREVKKHAVFDREASVWVKRESKAAFDAHRKERAAMLDSLVEKNRRYAIEVLGGKIVPDEKKG